MNSYKPYFPYDNIRSSQEEALDFAIAEFDAGKRFVIIEAGTGVGKSAIGYTIAKYYNSNKQLQKEGYNPGSYFVTTQKILQEQYLRDFSKHGMRSIKSATNFRCKYKRSNNCQETQNELRFDKKSQKLAVCMSKCIYKLAKQDFLNAELAVSNFPYVLMESNFSGQIKPRELLVIDEAHNASTELGRFVEVSVSSRFLENVLKIEFPEVTTQVQAYKWVKETYFPKLQSHMKHTEKMLQKFSGLREKLMQFMSLFKQLEQLENHYKKVDRFLAVYEKDNWVYDIVEEKVVKKITFKPIAPGPFAESTLFRLGNKVLLMSATILNKPGFCDMLGIPHDEASFISIPSPFPIENRPIVPVAIAKMTSNEIDKSLPKVVEGVRRILARHKGEKGIIHTHSYKVANFLKRNIRSKRLIFHDSKDRDAALRKHLRSTDATVLVSPSMTEGVDLADDCSRFQVICKIPYPYLGDKLIRKRMNKWNWWYTMETTKTIVQATGRSIRNEKDTAITYIIDSDWGKFFSRAHGYFPSDFKSCVIGTKK
jgi:ATP-dependent DNA helicase DinG